MTFTELSENWLAQKKMELKPGTYETYCYLVRKILQENLGAISTKKLNQEKLDELFYILQTSKRKRTNQPLCKELILKSFSITKKIIIYGQKEKYCKKFTIVFKQLKKNDERESKVKFFEEDEYKKIIEYCMVKNTNNFYSLGILIGLFEGLRIGEICGLKWEDIDFIHKKMTINRTVRCSENPETKKEEWIIGSPKTKTSRRTIPINNEIIRILENLQKHKKYTGYVIRNKLQKEILNSPLPCRPDLLRKSFYQFLKNLEISQRNFHCLRHTFASTAIRKGVSPKTVSEILGHSDVKITLNLYVHPNEEEKINCVNIFAKDVEEINAGTTSDSDGGSAVAALTVEEDTCADQPEDPTKDGYYFAGWVTSDGKPFEFTTKVTGNLELKATWTQDPVYTVTIVSNNGAKDSSVKATKDKEYKVTVSAPTKEGYTFKGWTTDKEGKTAADLTKAISENITIYAQWTINTYKVTFDVDGIEAQTVEYGKKATKPANPTKEGYTFKGWNFDFDKPVEKDVTVKAIWEEAVVTLAENWAYGETYEGPVTYSFVQNGDWGSQADPDNVPVYKLDLSSIATLKAKDMITLTFKINTSADLNQIGIVSNLNGWGWNALPAKAAGETYSIMLTVGDNFTGTEAQIKFVPQSSSKDLIGTDVTVTFTELTTSYEEFVAGAEQEIEIAKDLGSYAKFADKADLEGYLDSADGDVKLIFNCVLAIEEDNNYDYVGQIAGWDASWTNSTDDFGDFTFKLDGKVPESNNKGSEFEVEFDVATLLEKCSKTDLFCVNIWQEKFTISSVVVKYKAK